MIFRYLPAIIVDFLSYSSHPEGKSVESCSWIFDEKVNLMEGSAILNKKKINICELKMAKKNKFLWSMLQYKL